MSEPRTAPCPDARRNRATGRVCSPLARPLHGRVPIRIFGPAMLLSGCVIPPSLSVDTTDAGLNSPPAIVSVRADGVELPEWETVTFEQGAGTLNLTVYDTDLDDTLYPKVFIDYNIPDQTPPRSNCTPASGNTVARSSTCDLRGLCLTADIGRKPDPVMQVVVFDRQVVEGQIPLHQALPPGGLSTSRTYTLICQRPP